MDEDGNQGALSLPYGLGIFSVPGDPRRSSPDLCIGKVTVAEQNLPE